jgi:very-short-patch-repair endonuclease
MRRQRDRGESERSGGDVIAAGESPERAIDGLARRQHGVVARAQLVRLGLGPRAIDRRIQAGRLRRLHRGVYAVGAIRAPNEAEMAAALACGNGSAVSHRFASALWHLLPYPARDRAVDVTVPDRRARSRPGIRVHRGKRLRADELTKVSGIPVTTPARTLLDLAAEVTARELEQAVAEAQRRGLTSRERLRALLARHRGRPGTRRLRAVLEAPERPALTRSRAEDRLLALIRKARLPGPDVNARIGPYEVDFLWRDACLVVEVDGYAFHSGRTSFESDRRRDADLAARGLTVIRVTWHQLVDEPEATLVRLGQTLARSKAS